MQQVPISMHVMQNLNSKQVNKYFAGLISLLNAQRDRLL